MSKPTLQERAALYCEEILPLLDRVDRVFWEIHLEKFAAREVARVRRDIAKPLRSLLKAFPGAWCCALHEKEPVRRVGCSFCERRQAVRAIDLATRAPRKAKP